MNTTMNIEQPVIDKAARQQVYFIICQSCYWSASDLSGGIAIEECHLCKSKIIEAIPVSANEMFRCNFANSGVTIEFIPRK